MKKKLAVVIQHLAFEDLGSLAPALKQHDYDIAYYQAGVDNLDSISQRSPDLLIILGGPISANDIDDYPFLLVEEKLIQQRLACDKPTLGICLGAQLIAKCLGSCVYAAKEKELGWQAIHINEAHDKFDGMMHLNENNCKLLHWHGETFDLPKGALRLASTTHCENQAFQYQNSTLGLQFHPEILEKNFEKWLIGHTLEISQTSSVNIASLRHDAKQYAPCLEKYAADFWHAWLDFI